MIQNIMGTCFYSIIPYSCRNFLVVIVVFVLFICYFDSNYRKIRAGSTDYDQGGFWFRRALFKRQGHL